MKSVVLNMKTMAVTVCLMLGFSFALADAPASGAQTELERGAEPEAGIEDIDPTKWGIRNDCVSTRRIRNADVLSSDTVLLTMTGGKKILMHFKKSCRGLKHNGFVYSSRTGKLCARFDSVTVMDTGSICLLEAFEPFLELDIAEPINEGEPLDE